MIRPFGASFTLKQLVEVVADITVEKDEAVVQRDAFQSELNSLSSKTFELERKVDKLEEERASLLSEKSALTGRVVELQTAVTSAGIKVPHKRRRKKT